MSDNTVVKTVKHIFSGPELAEKGKDLSRTFSDKRGVEGDFDAVKADFKSRISLLEAGIEKISTEITNGFHMVEKKCRVVYKPEETPPRKYFFPVDSDSTEAALVEVMNESDFIRELIEAEADFECRKELPLFVPTEKDNGIAVVGRFGGKWYSALRITVGNHKLQDRLDSEQPCVKKREDAVALACKRAMAWLKEKLGKDAAKGFQENIKNIADENRGIEE